MNKKTPYELIIANKAEQQALPDLADAIWASVSAGLDALPTSTGENSDGSAESAAKNSTVSATIVAKGISVGHFVLYGVIVTVLITVAILFWWKQQPGKHQPQEQPPVPAHTTPVPQQQQENSYNDSIIIKPSATPVIPSRKEKPATTDSTQVINAPHLMERIPATIPIAPTLTPSIIAPDTVPITPPPAKKPRGVKGISSSDYKIVPVKQDSLLKKQR